MDGFETFIENKKKELETKARNAVSKIADDLTLEADRAIEDFYSWKPNRYKRHGSTIKPIRFYKNPHGTIYRGGVELPSSTGMSYHANYLPDHPSVSSEYIADLIYSGHHGATECFPKWVLNHVRNYPPIMSPSPIEMIEKKYDDILDNMEKYFV